MIRIHTAFQGSRLRREPKRLPAEGRVRLEIEVDGVQVCDGQLEGELLPTLTLFCESLAALHRGQRQVVALPFSDGACELILARRGSAALLSIVRLGRPARLLVSDLEVELDSMVQATIDCCARHRPEGASESLEGRRFKRAFRQLSAAYLRGATEVETASVREVETLANEKRSLDEVSVIFELWDAHGRLEVGGEEAWGLHPLLLPGRLRILAPGADELQLEGVPFLLLRDLCESSTRLLRMQRESGASVPQTVGLGGVELSLEATEGGLRLGDSHLTCPVEAWTRALCLAATELERLLVERNPALLQNPHLRDLGESARSRLALVEEWELARRPVAPTAFPRQPGQRRERAEQAPLRGELRRISLLPSWQKELPAVHRLLPCGKEAWVQHEAGWSRLRMADGALLAAHAGAEGSLAVAEGAGPVLRLEEGRLLRLGAGAWSVELGLERLGPTWLRRSAEAWLLVDDASLLCVGLRDGALAFRLDPPAALRSRWTRAGDLLVLASDNGLLYAVDMGRRELAWRLPLHLDPIATGNGWVAGAMDGPRGLELVGVRAADRSIGFRLRLPLHQVREVRAVERGFVVAGAGPAGGEVLRVDLQGRIRWSARPILGPGAPSLTLSGATVFARGSEGACRITRGKVRWSVPAGPGGAPRLVRGMVALPGDRLALLDGETGRSLLAPGAAPWEADFLAGASDHLLVADHHGSLVGLRIAGGLAVL